MKISRWISFGVAAAGLVGCGSAASDPATVETALSVALTNLSSDPYTNASSQHRTQVEPDTFAHGNTFVSAFQSGRFTDGGSSNIGWATSTDGGNTWANGFLPGITKYQGGSYDRTTDPSVAYDARHGVWLISSLPIVEPSLVGAAVVVNRSTDGINWDNAVTVATAGGSDDFDKNWTVCDNHPSSPFYGNCYTEFDNYAQGDLFLMSTSTDGGLTWSVPQPTANKATGLGGQPLVQPDGTVIVAAANAPISGILAFRSTDGGNSWSASVPIAGVKEHTPAGNLRSDALPSAEIDAAGKVYVVWSDCRFTTGCKNNDMVMSTSTDGVTWSPVVRIPTDGGDHFIPGLAVDENTAGGSAHLALSYYYYDTPKCGKTCQLKVGSVSSVDGGANWSAVTQLAGPFSVSWIPNTSDGVMVGDYISTSFVNGAARSVFAVANAPSGSVFDEAMYTTTSPLVGGAAVAAASSAGAPNVPYSPNAILPAASITHRF
jgi:hypothetical protein